MGTYGDSGVDVPAGDRFTASLHEVVSSTWGDDVVGGFGGFAAGIRLPAGYEDPVLMMTTDGVGTKAEVARAAGRYDGLGHDLVAMCVDDLAAVGARPLALTDYLAVGRLHATQAGAIVASVAAACRVAGCALVAGETAEHPGVLEPDQFDLAGTALGILEAGNEVTGAAIEVGDSIVAVSSPNLRSNGFSLIRALVLPQLAWDEEFPGTAHTVTDVLLEPSVIYAPAVMWALTAAPIHGLAHITGGGLPGKLRRILPAGHCAVVDASTWTPPPVFDTVARLGKVPSDEMFTTFNMGVGFAAVVPPDSVNPVISAFAEAGHDAWEMGTIIAGERGVTLIG